MHDFYLAKQILELVLDYAKRRGLNKISRVVISLGKIVEHNEEMKPENLRFNFNLLTKGTIAKKAKLTIKKSNKSNYWKLEGMEGR